jgi:hypothetical protein
MPGRLSTHDGRRSIVTPYPHVDPPPLHELLAFADRRLPDLRPRPRAVRERFGLTEVQYQAALIRAIDDPAAWAMYPALMRRLEERRAKGRARRRLNQAIEAEGVS